MPDTIETPAVDPAISAAAVANERARVAGIHGVARKLNVGDDVVARAVNDGMSLEAFRAVAIDAAAERQAPASFAPNAHASDPHARRAPAQARAEKPKGTDAARALIALAATRGSKRDAADFVSQHYGADGQGLARALSTSVGSSGGFLVPADMAGEVIELLRPASTVMSLQPTIVPMPRGNMAVPRLDSSSNASYVGENQPIPASQPSFGMVQLVAKKLASVVPISNDMVRFPTAATDSIVRDDMVQQIATRSDLAFIRGAGTQFSPRGLRSFAYEGPFAATNYLVASYKVGSDYGSQSQQNAITAVATVTFDLGKAELALEGANVKMTRPGWIFHPRTKTYLMNLRDGLGRLVYADEMARGVLRGKPFRTSTQIPTNLQALASDGSTVTYDGSEIYLADFAQVLIGEAYGIELEVFPGGSYLDAAGNIVSGISNDQTVIRALIEHDMAMRHDAAVAVLTGVRWF